MLLGIAELLDVQVPRVLFLIRRMQEMLGKDYVSALPDVHVSIGRGRALPPAADAKNAAPVFAPFRATF